MRIAVLGTGMVGQALAGRLVERGHEVMMGSRQAGNANAVAWAQAVGPGASEGSFADAAGHGELVVNATNGMVSLEALRAAGAENLAGKVLVDVSNPLDTTRGMPFPLTVCNDDSLAEQIQRAFPEARVVKTLNTMNNQLMIYPEALPEHHTVFVSGDDSGAKDTVRDLLGSFGWPREDIIDLGDITTARGPEMYFALWVRLWPVVGGGFNIHVVAPETAR